MDHDVQRAGHEATLSARLGEATGQSVAKCYQCGKCSAGCPLAEEMDYPSSQVLRMLQLGFPDLDEQVLRSHAIWLCLTCEMCHARCPKEVDLPRIMEFLREESMRRKCIHPKAKDIVAFHKAFLDSVQHAGRLYEAGLVGDYKLRSWHFLQDLLVAPKLLFRGKLKLWPHLIRGRHHVARLFKRAAHKQGGEQQ